MSVEEVYAEEWGGWVRYAARLTHPDQAEDVVGGVVLRMLEVMAEGGVVQNVAGYVYAGIENAAVDWYRSREVELPLMEGDAVSGMGGVFPGRLESVLLTLPPLQQRILSLRYAEGATTAEMAEELGLSLGSIKWAIWSALEALREEMDVPHSEYGTEEVADRRRLVSELLGQGWSRQRLADEVGVSLRTLYRDIAALE